MVDFVTYLNYLELWSNWLHAQGRMTDGSFQVHEDAPNPPWWDRA